MQDLWAFPTGVSPFGNPWIKAHLQLPMAYRSLSRPSSAPSAKAFSLRSFLLDQSWFSQELLWQPLLGLLYLHTLCQNRKTFKLIFVHLNVFSIVAFFFPLFSFQCAFLAFRPGGDEQNRTVDPLLARQVLSQLSYTPK